MFHLWEMRCKVKNNSSPTKLCRCLCTIKMRKWRLCSSWPYMAGVLHSCPDLTLVKLEDSRKSQIPTGVVQDTNNLTSIFSNGSYIQVSSGLLWDYSQEALKAWGLPERTPVHCDRWKFSVFFCRFKYISACKYMYN